MQQELQNNVHSNPAADGQFSQSAANGELHEVDFKSTKSNIWSAYKNLLKKYEENLKTKRVDQPKRAVESQLVKKVGEYTLENISQGLNDLKVSLGRAVDQLANDLMNETKKMSEIQQAVKIQQQKIKDLYQIETSTETLEALIKTQAIKKEEFETEFEKMKRDREREKEEYKYNLTQERKKEQTEWQEKREKFQKQEQELKNREQELLDLRQKVEEFPKKTEQVIKETQDKTKHQVSREMQTRADLLAKEVEGEKKVLETKLSYGEDLIAKQNEQINSLKEKLDQANRQVQEIAEKALESSSGKQTLKAVSDLALQRAGKGGGEEGKE